jgi:hypothetical protein
MASKAYRAAPAFGGGRKIVRAGCTEQIIIGSQTRFAKAPIASHQLCGDDLGRLVRGRVAGGVGLRARLRGARSCIGMRVDWR